MLGLGLGLTGRGVLQGGAGVTAWTPLDLGASLKAWWSADDHGTARMTDDGAGLISSWTDKIAAIAVTGTTTARPTWAATSFNSAYAGLTFDGTANCLVSTAFTALPTGAVAGEVWAIASNTLVGSAAAARSAVHYGASTTNVRALIRVGVTNVARLRVNDGTASLTDTAITLDGPHIMGGAWSGTTQTGRIDGRDTNPASGVITTLATSAAGRIRIGASSAITAGAFWIGVIRHVLVTTTLTGTEREKLEGWMAHDANLTSVLPGGHPYKSAPP